jgi:UDP:flavonoid glycosyltransferase YjiC (YdhE family)
VRPLAYDQFDNAHRLVRLGVARTIPPARYRAAAVAASLEELIRSEEIREAASSIRERLRGYDAVSATSELILKELTGRA